MAGGFELLNFVIVNVFGLVLSLCVPVLVFILKLALGLLCKNVNKYRIN
jgi:hypothetical protein